MKAIMCLSLVCVCACAKALPAAVPAADFAACVAVDAIEGKSIAQMAVDCGGDVAQVIGILETSTDPGVQASAGKAEADRAVVVLTSVMK